VPRLPGIRPPGRVSEQLVSARDAPLRSIRNRLLPIGFPFESLTGARGVSNGDGRGDIKGFMPLKLPKLYLTTEAELLMKQISICGCKRAAGQFFNICLLYVHNDTFLTDITGCDRLKFS